MGESWEAMPDSYPIYNGENDATFCCDRFFAAKTESYVGPAEKGSVDKTRGGGPHPHFRDCFSPFSNRVIWSPKRWSAFRWNQISAVRCPVGTGSLPFSPVRCPCQHRMRRLSAVF